MNLVDSDTFTIPVNAEGYTTTVPLTIYIDEKNINYEPIPYTLSVCGSDDVKTLIAKDIRTYDASTDPE